MGTATLRSLIDAWRPSNARQQEDRVLDARERESLSGWLLTHTESAWIPEWLRPIIAKRPRAIILRDGSLPGFTITCIGLTKDAHTALKSVFPVAAAGYQVLSSYALAKRRPIPQAHIVYIPCSRRRALPKSPADPVTPECINGGMTTFMTQPAKHPWRIIVFRREDADKVMLHELVHLFRVDGNRIDDSVEQAWIRARGWPVRSAPPTRYLNAQESITEALGCYMGVVFRRRLSMPFVTLAVAYRWMLGAAAHLLARGIVVDGTHAFSYMVLRAVLWDERGPCSAFFELIESQDPSAGLMDLIDLRMPEFLERLRRRPPAFTGLAMNDA